MHGYKMENGTTAVPVVERHFALADVRRFGRQRRYMDAHIYCVAELTDGTIWQLSAKSRTADEHRALRRLCKNASLRMSAMRLLCRPGPMLANSGIAWDHPIPGHQEAQMTTTITVELDSAVGPRVIVDGDPDVAEIEAALPAGRALSETPAVKTDTGGWS